MTTKRAQQRVTVTVGEMIAAVFDVVGNEVDRAVELLVSDEMRNHMPIEIEGAQAGRVTRSRG